ncbi:MAG TPA: 8-amino-7-oxononanoate synthase [Candidatus Limnocylindrales bacterium]|jgi:8-amino-7-oxononanoate synthase|nr:8-amino-7-oxononanoate synthase [Candidatus Limnocylindrales bacterium]
MRTVEFDDQLKQRLAELRDQGLYRQLRRVDSGQSSRICVQGEMLLNFSSNDYLGLANETVLKDAAIEAVNRYGAGAGASRLICGSLNPHHELDQNIAQFKNAPAALSFSSGYAAALGTICALLGKSDIIILDKLVHACIVDAARLCGARIRVFAHNDLNDLERILRWVQQQQSQSADSRALVLTESVFSMDGDFAPLKELVALKNRYGVWLMVDEAHATGLYGKDRRGMAEALGVSEQIEVQMGTLGKALGASGGYVCGSQSLIEYLVNRSRSFIFSTAPVPAAAAAATAGIRFVQSSDGEERRNNLWQRAAELASRLRETTHARFEIARSSRESGTNVSDGPELPGAIFPLIVGDESKAVEISRHLRERGIFIPAIRYPTVARGSARLRLTLTAAHTSDDINTLCRALDSLQLSNPQPQ